MHSYIVTAFALVMLAITLAVAPAQAQSGDTLTITIPFAFTVGSEPLPAGKYTVRRTSQTSSAFLIQNAEGTAAVAVLSGPRLHGGRRVAPGKLVFHAYEGEHFLAQVWMPWSASGSELTISDAEKRLARTGAEAEPVAVLAHRQ
jgi:hypothetical protein